MKLFAWLFVVSLIVELLLLGCSATLHGDHLFYAPLIPAILDCDGDWRCPLGGIFLLCLWSDGGRFPVCNGAFRIV